MLRIMRRVSTTAYLALLLTASSLSAQTESPKLVVLIVVDQMRADYIKRFQHQWNAGLKRLVDDGAWFQQAAYPYVQTNTCVGHSTIATGSLPESHGIVGNNWYDRAESRLRACADDPEGRLLTYDNPVDATQGPGSLLVPTLGDELRAQAGARVVSMSMKPRVGVMLAGHRADMALWRQETAWVTSAAYAAAPVPFVARFLDANPVADDLGEIWSRAMPEDTYLFDGSVDVSRPFDGWATGLPHPLVGRDESADQLFYDKWAASPLSNDYLGRLAIVAVNELDLGQREATDYLALGLSALDWAGHRFGPKSHEVQDVLFRLDLMLGRLLDDLDAAVGPDRYVVALSADHGVTPIPERRARLADAGRIPAQRIVDAAEAAMREEFGPGEYVAQFEEQDFYFAPGVYARLLADPSALAAVSGAIEAIVGVAKVYRGDTIRERRDTGDSIERALARGYYPGRSGDLLVVLRPYWTTSTNAAGHGTSYGYDTRVPILFMGAGVTPGHYLAEVTPADIAPTLAEIVGITLARTDGRVLTEALDNP
ncbi:MAG: alkaline phosphatase family protein [Vicinamibacterales bacterium]|jgi:predicted AlkP superfamily pyrophosphatase or phosphodiesterase|nr:alkaline phosphatase family protein [Vicinamibacterales bacterium]